MFKLIARMSTFFAAHYAWASYIIILVIQNYFQIYI